MATAGLAGLIPACELQEIQAAAEALLDTPITVARPPQSGTATNGYGHPAAGASTLVASVNALFKTPTGPVLAQIASRIGALVVWVMSVPTSTDIKTGDQVTVTSTGEVFEVHVVQTPQSYSPLLSVIVGKVR